ncbi:MAG: beta-ketoacyl synthase N-terminal-like domain-containing protein [Ferruginibacter sp.]
MYIRATGNISPQHTFGNSPFLAEPVTHAGNRLTCVEPDYKTIIDPKLIRRMSRIIKMGVAAAMDCLQQSGVQVPDAIVTGTAYGCLEDTGIFLSRMVEQQEELLAPTAFIQSTHNTVGAQIALMLHCNGYNNVFVHRAFSFENALLDAMMLIEENEAGNVLVGGVDEITNISHTILSRLGLYKPDLSNNFELYRNSSKGTVAGEGAAFFLLSNEPGKNNCVQLSGITTFYKPATIEETQQQIEAFLSSHSIAVSDVDLLITGRNGDHATDKIYDLLDASIFNKVDSVNYKNLCGEYPTSTAFALWLAVQIMQRGELPPILDNKVSAEKKMKKILIYNQSQNTHHSLLLISAC